MFSKNASRWFGILFLVMLALRIGYKYYRAQQKPAYEARMQDLEARNQALKLAIQADQDAQRAQGAVVVVADSAGLAGDTAARTK